MGHRISGKKKRGHGGAEVTQQGKTQQHQEKRQKFVRPKAAQDQVQRQKTQRSQMQKKRNLGKQAFDPSNRGDKSFPKNRLQKNRQPNVLMEPKKPRVKPPVILAPSKPEDRLRDRSKNRMDQRKKYEKKINPSIPGLKDKVERRDLQKILPNLPRLFEPLREKDRRHGYKNGERNYMNFFLQYFLPLPWGYYVDRYERWNPNQKTYAGRQLLTFEARLDLARSYKRMVVYGDELFIPYKLNQIARIDRLELTVVDVNEAVLERVSLLKNMIRLNVVDNDLRGDSLMYLLPLSGLRILDVTQVMGLYEEDIYQIEQDMPRLRVIW